MATESGTGERGEYLTRRRAQVLNERIDELERTTSARLDTLERRVAFVLEFPVELAKRQTSALFDAVKTFSRRSGGGAE